MIHASWVVSISIPKSKTIVIYEKTAYKLPLALVASHPFPMRPLTLCRERLERILRILSRNAGALPVREFARSFSVWEWEIDQAAALGWLTIEIRKPRTGRPSRIVQQVSKTQAAKLPPYRCQIEKPISIRHQLFAMHTTFAVKRGSRKLANLPSITDAYQSVFKRATKRRAAAASASRLMRRSDVKAARSW